jgi:hypothetical protein
MTYQTILGPLSRLLCCLIPFAWLPVLLIIYVARGGWRERRDKYKPLRHRDIEFRQ